MSVNQNVVAPQFPVELSEVLARAQKAAGVTVRERVWNALTSHEDTVQWLDAMAPVAFTKGAAKEAIPAASSATTVPVRAAVMDSVFAWAKKPKTGEKYFPGVGYVEVSEADLLSPTLQYNLGGGDEVDLSAVLTLQSLSVDFTTEGAEAQALEETARRQQDWAHGENPVQEFDAELRDLGIDAGSLEEAAQMLALEEGQEDLLSRVRTRQTGFNHELTRDYGSFKTVPTVEADVDHRASLRPLPVSAALKGATVVMGNWDSLNVPRRLKAEAFDRLVDMFSAQFRQLQPTTVAGDVDDLVGKAALMAAKALGIRTVAVSMEAYGDFAPAKVQASMFAARPKGKAVQVAEGDMAEVLALASKNLLVLGGENRVEVATAAFTHAKKGVKTLGAAWARHNGLY